MAARPHDRAASSGNRQARSSTDPNRENYYQLLNIPYSANPAQITRAYREQMKRYHPDRVADLGTELQQVAHQKTLDIQRAYEELK